MRGGRAAMVGRRFTSSDSTVEREELSGGLCGRHGWRKASKVVTVGDAADLLLTKACAAARSLRERLAAMTVRELTPLEWCRGTRLRS
jgi:hypothetical protein